MNFLLKNRLVIQSTNILLIVSPRLSLDHQQDDVCSTQQ